MKPTLYADLAAALAEHPRARLVARSNMGPHDRSEHWLVGTDVWMVMVHGEQAYAYVFLDDPAGVLARMKAPEAVAGGVA